MSFMPNSATEIWEPLPFDDSFNCKFSFPAPYAPFHHSINSFGGNTTHGPTPPNLPQRTTPSSSSSDHKITKIPQRDTPEPEASNGWRETIDCYTLKVDLSRFMKEDIKVKVEHEAVKLSGNNGFSTTVPFPERSDASYVSTEFENGILTVNAPKKYGCLSQLY